MRNYFLIVDTETTGGALNEPMVADFGAVIVDARGKVYTQCGVLVEGIYTDKENYPLFSFKSEGIWDTSRLPKRYAAYDNLLSSGARMLANVAAINRWLARAAKTYRPIMTAYHLEFDTRHCRSTGIDLDLFEKRFCLMKAAQSTFATTKAYRWHVLQTLAFNAPTKCGNMSYKTNAETMARFCLGNPDLPDEPHTALEDALFYELPVLQALLKKHSAKKLATHEWAHHWDKVQVKNWFKPV